MRGGNAAWLAKVQESKGIKVQALSKVPTLFQDVIWVWNGFQVLSGRRGYGFSSPNPISFESIRAYTSLAGIDRDDDLDFFLRVIPMLDDIWLDDWVKRSEREKAKKPKK